MKRLAIACAVFAVVSPAPAWAQDHSSHHGDHGHSDAAAEPAGPQPPPADPHAGHAMPADTPPMDHSAMGHDMPAEASPGPTMETPPPPEAGSGPPRAADAIWGAEAMAASRRDLRATHGDFPVFWFQADRAEVQARSGADDYLWDVQGYYGGPARRLWFKSEGEGHLGEAPGEAEVQLLYAHAIAPFFDLQAGVRQDFGGRDTAHAVIGVQGTAPYMVELDAALFLSHRGDLTARIEGELDQRITQALIVQPRAELSLSAQDVPELGIGAGLDRLALGVRLRYEIRRELAPYVGIEQNWAFGRSADFARAAGGDPSTAQLVAGVRFWF